MTADSLPLNPVQRRKRRRRRFILLLLLPVLLATVGWRVVEQLIDIEGYRPLIEEKLERLTKLPLSFGAMDLQLFPTPRLVVEDVTLGEGDFMVHSSRVSVTANLLKLLSRQLDLRTVTLHAPRIQLSEARADFIDRWNAYIDTLKAPRDPKKKARLKVTLDEIVADDVQVFRGDQLFATGTLTVSTVTGGAPVFAFDTMGVGIAGCPTAAGSLTLTVKEDPILRGEATVEGVPLANLLGDDRLPPFLLDGTLDYQLRRGSQFVCNVQGTVRRTEPDRTSGSFSVQSTFGKGTLTLTGLRIETPPLAFLGDLEFSAGKTWTLAINEATLIDEGVDGLLAYLPTLPFRPSVDTVARCVLEKMRLSKDASGAFSIESGELRTEGVDLVLDGPSYVLSGLRSHLIVSGDHYEIKDISSDYLNVSGTLDLRSDGSRILELTGRGNLGPDFPLPPKFDRVLRLEEGTINIKRFSTTLVQGQPVFPESYLNITLRDGTVALWNRDQGNFVLLEEVGASLVLDGGVLYIDELRAAGSAVRGTLEPDEQFECWTFTTALESDLTRPFWKPFYPDTQFSITSGILRCPLVAGTYTRSDGQIIDLNVEGQVSDLEMKLSLAEYRDNIHIDTIDLSSKNNHLLYEMEGRTEKLGTLSVTGNYAPEHDILDVAISLDPVTAGRSLLPAPYWKEYGEVILGHLEPITLEARYLDGDHTITFKADGPASITGSLDLTNVGTVERLTLLTDFPALWFADHLPDTVMLSGSAEAAVQFEPATGIVESTLILTDTEGAWRSFKKPAGFQAALEMSGQWRGGNFQDIGGTLRLGDTVTPLQAGSDGLASDRVDLALDELTPLLPPGGTLGGKLSGRFSTTPLRVNLRAEKTTLQLAEALPPLAMDGPLLHDEQGWRFDEVHVSQGAQEAILSISDTDGPWEGTVYCRAFNVDQALADYETLRQWWADQMPPDTTPGGKTKLSALRATVTLAADTLTWGETVAEELKGSLTLAENSQVLSDLRFKNGDGLCNGSISVLDATEEKPGRVDLDLVLMSIDLGVIESMLGQDTRHMHGLVDGRAVLTIALPSDGTSVLHGIDGRVEFSAREGTLGKAGIASKLLTALRATDILRLRIPSLRDKGVTFQTLAGQLKVEAGRFILFPYHMEDSTYTLDADTVFDFPENTASGTINLQILEGVTGIARKIPLLGGAVNLVNKVFDVELRVSGSAMEPTFRAVSVGPMKSLGSGARTLLKGTQKLVGQ